MRLDDCFGARITSALSQFVGWARAAIWSTALITFLAGAVVVVLVTRAFRYTIRTIFNVLARMTIYCLSPAATISTLRVAALTNSALG